MRKYCILLLCFIFYNCQSQMDKMITTSEQLKKQEGKLVEVRGNLLSSDPMKRVPVRMQLEDSSFVYIGSFENASKLDFNVIQKYFQKRVIIKGVVYIDSIPEKYKIISRLSGPYLVDIQEVDIVK
jgi:hypothetical protein